MRTLQPEFTFAGFVFPRYLANLPSGSVASRIARMRNPVTGGYYHAPTPNTRADIGCYHESAGWPNLRFSESSRSWRGDDSGAEFRGVVFRLPRGRGFLAGFTAGAGMYAGFSREIFDDEDDAMRYAKSQAESAAESAAEHSERFNAMCLAEIDAEEKTLELQKAIALRHREKFGGFDRVRDAIEELRTAREALRDATAAYERG